MEPERSDTNARFLLIQQLCEARNRPAGFRADLSQCQTGEGLGVHVPVAQHVRQSGYGVLGIAADHAEHDQCFRPESRIFFLDDLDQMRHRGATDKGEAGRHLHLRVWLLVLRGDSLLGLGRFRLLVLEFQD